ncbi:hypothetical protein LshimejAT787_1900120 [Lyophyllum shimeji]|uniref:Uncharacterized protein n=1 Tax=Lyophyllum shimeji TaxID=47721 RepID=A0A9P3URC8_LYOSH|nr:hypothetical protein LshimejAT787_1900120 [Lyophyllum shimeji]
MFVAPHAAWHPIIEAIVMLDTGPPLTKRQFEATDLHALELRPTNACLRVASNFDITLMTGCNRSLRA